LRQPPEASFDPFVDRPLIREALLHLVPDSVRLNRRKSNLSGFYFDGIVADLPAIERLLRDPGARVLEYVDREALDRILSERPRREDRASWRWSTALWTITGLEVWLRQAEDSRAIAELLDWGLTEPHSTVCASPS